MAEKKSVIRTDLFQILIIIIGMIVLFWQAFKAAGPLPLIQQSFPTSAEMNCWEVISMILVVGSAYLIGPDMYSNIFSSHSSKEAKASAFISAILLIPLAFLITSLGIFSRYLYPAITPEQAIPSLMAALLSPAIVGLVAAALLAAFMSSADTCLMTATSILTFDIYGEVYRRMRSKADPNATQDHMMKVSRIAVVAIGASALILAVSNPDIIKTLLIAYTVFTSGLLIPVLAGFYKDRLGLTPNGALSAIAGGGFIAIILGQSHPLLGMTASAVILFAASWLERWLARRRKENL